MSKSALTQGVYGSDTNNHVIFEKQSYERKKKLGNREAASHRGDDSGSFGSDTRGYLRAKKISAPQADPIHSANSRRQFCKSS